MERTFMNLRSGELVLYRSGGVASGNRILPSYACCLPIRVG